jgi:alkylated DNA nucleotide flippase Atl1
VWRQREWWRVVECNGSVEKMKDGVEEDQKVYEETETETPTKGTAGKSSSVTRGK